MGISRLQRTLTGQTCSLKELRILLFTCLVFSFIGVGNGSGQERPLSSSLILGRLKYNGGGDWYNDPSALVNLANTISRQTTVDIRSEEKQVSLMDESLFAYPFLFVTGHGRMVLDEMEISRLRQYLLTGGFLYCDDDYGLDKSFRAVMKKVFPEKAFVELAFSHEIYHIHFQFPGGLPKIHEHDDKAPRGFGMMDDSGRLMVFYTYETNISDGWADAHVHQNTEEKREQAFKMGVNIVLYALMH